MRLEGKAAIVTGGGGGLGEGICLCLAREGANVVVSDVDEKLAQAVTEKVKEAGRKSLAIRTDVRFADQCQALVDATLKELGDVDILVCSAGVSGFAHREFEMEDGNLIENLTVEDWDFVLDVNLKGVFLCNRAVAPHFRKQGSGKIVNISSVGGRRGDPFLTAYSVSKAAVIALTQAVALQMAPHHVNVNAVCPGIIYTPMWEHGAKLLAKAHPLFKGSEIDGKDALDMMVKLRIPFGHMQTAEDIGNSVVFLASEEAREITGQALNVCGGMVSS